MDSADPRQAPQESRAPYLVRGVVLLDNSGGDPSAVGYFNALTARPFPNGTKVLARPCGSRGSRTSRTTTPTTHLGCRIEVRLESLCHRGSVLLRQVNRVVHAIERKSNLCCVLRAIEIVGDLSNRCFRHGSDRGGSMAPLSNLGLVRPRPPAQSLQRETDICLLAERTT